MEVVKIEPKQLRIPGRNINLFMSRIDEANKRFGENAHLDVEYGSVEIVSGSSKSPEQSDIYYNPKVSGFIQCPNMKPLARIEYLDDSRQADKSIFREYSGNDMSLAEKRLLESSHGATCDCCGVNKAGKTARKNITAYRCVEDFTIEVNGKTREFKKGGFYQIGDDCKDYVDGLDAVSFLNDLEEKMPRLQTERISAPHEIEPMKYLQYVTAVGLSHIDDAMNYCNRRKYDDIKSVCADYMRCPTTYRNVTQLKSGEFSSSINRAALALYQMDVYGVVPSSMPQSDIAYLRKATNFDNMLADPRVRKFSADVLKHNEGLFANSAFRQDILDNNTQSLLKMGVVHDKAGQLLVDLADAYMIEELHSPALHQEKHKDDILIGDNQRTSGNALYNVSDISTRWRDLLRYDLKVYTKATLQNDPTQHLTGGATFTSKDLCDYQPTVRQLTDLVYQRPITFEVPANHDPSRDGHKSGETLHAMMRFSSYGKSPGWRLSLISDEKYDTVKKAKLLTCQNDRCVSLGNYEKKTFAPFRLKSDGKEQRRLPSSAAEFLENPELMNTMNVEYV